MLTLALQVLGFEGYVEEVEEVLKDHKQQVKVPTPISSVSPLAVLTSPMPCGTIGSGKESFQVRTIWL